MSVATNINAIKKELPEGVKLVAVSKFHPAEVVREAYNTGHRIFGESKMQELSDKHLALPDDIQWHFIGHLQTNKVKAILPYTHTIQSIDSWKLLDEVEKQAKVIGKHIHCLLEIHIAKEESKYGLSFDECRHFFASGQWQKYNFVRIAGLMGMATNTEDEDQIRSEFRKLKSLFDELKKEYLSDFPYFTELSMGMSGDYHIAIEEGSTMIRVGTSIFGEREY